MPTQWQAPAPAAFILGTHGIVLGFKETSEKGLGDHTMYRI